MKAKSDAVKKQYCIGTWNVWFMNQGKLDEERGRVNIGILGISELKWMGMGEFNSEDQLWALNPLEEME